MATPSFDSASSGTNTTANHSSLSYSHTLASGSGNKRIMLIGVTGDDQAATGVTVGGTAATLLGSTQTGGNAEYSLWYILDTDLPASSGSTTIVVSIGGAEGNDDTVACSVAYTRVDQVAPTTPSNTTVATATSISDSLSIAADSILLGFAFHDTAEAHTADTGQTERVNDTTTNYSASIGTEAFTSSGTESMGWSWSTSSSGAQLLTSFAIGADIEPTGISTDETFGTLTIVAIISPTGLSSTEAFGSTTLVGNLNPASISSAEAFGSPQAAHAISATGIASSESFGTPVFAVLQLTGVSTSEAFGTLGLATILYPSGITSDLSFGTLAFPTWVILDLPSASFAARVLTSGDFVLRDSIGKMSISSDESFGTPGLS